MVEGSVNDGPEIPLDQIDEMEKESLEKANKAISAIENAIAVWEASPDKPEDLKARIERLKFFYDSLVGWEKRSLQTAGKAEARDERVERLKEFVRICTSYS